MDPLKPYSFKHCHTSVNGMQYHYIDQSPSESNTKPPIVLVHGFPDVHPSLRSCLLMLLALVRLALSNPPSRQCRPPSNRPLLSRLQWNRRTPSIRLLHSQKDRNRLDCPPQITGYHPRCVHRPWLGQLHGSTSRIMVSWTCDCSSHYLCPVYTTFSYIFLVREDGWEIS